MHIDHELIEGARRVDEVARKIVRGIDIAVVPTSLSRTVMRHEDEHLKSKQWEDRVYGERYHSKSRARWVAPVAYTVAGIGETVRLFGYGYGLFKIGEALFG